MPIYFGIPTRVQEAIRILNLDLEKITEEVIKQKYYGDYTFVKIANNYLDKSTIQIYYLDKGMCVCGFIIEEPSHVWDNLINVDEFVIKLLNYQRNISLLKKSF